MNETERMLIQSLKRMEENCNARLTALSTRLDMQEDKQMLLQTELRTLKRLFNDVNEVYGSLQTLLATLKNGASRGNGRADRVCGYDRERHAWESSNAFR